MGKHNREAGDLNSLSFSSHMSRAWGAACMAEAAQVDDTTATKKEHNNNDRIQWMN